MNLMASLLNNNLRTMFNKYLLFFLINIFISCNSSVYGFSVGSNQTILTSDNEHSNNDGKKVEGLGNGTIIGVVAASIVTGIILLFVNRHMCNNNVDTESDEISKAKV
uniref:NADH-quinone oxidoreductase subunit K n=1 Tax=Anthurium amnicola TaxID=1678845 RepID=A0A1D1XIY3_9ARAE